jgi:hypothetical protein
MNMAEHDDIIDAIEVLDENNEDHWTTTGKPDTRALSDVLDRQVTAAERDAAWEAYNAPEFSAEDETEQTVEPPVEAVPASAEVPASTSGERPAGSGHRRLRKKNVNGVPVLSYE